MLKYPTDEELEEWFAQTSGEKPLTLKKGQMQNAILRLISALRAELHDIGLITRCVGEAYDELTGGLMSKPNTEPAYVIERVRELQDQEIKDAISHAVLLIADSFEIDLDDIDTMGGWSPSEKR